MRSYALGCNGTANSGGGSCAQRFKTDWIDVYKTHHTPAIQHLKWCAPQVLMLQSQRQCREPAKY